jgi:hypothetical protein
VRLTFAPVATTPSIRMHRAKAPRTNLIENTFLLAVVKENQPGNNDLGLGEIALKLLAKLLLSINLEELIS